MCPYYRYRGAEGCGFAGSNDGRSAIYGWTSRDCTDFVSVTTEPAGWVGVVHSRTRRTEFRVHAEETFPVRWDGGRYPTPENNCFTGNGTHENLCTVDTNPVTQSSVCLCPAVVSERAVFNTSTSDPLPTVAMVLEHLAIGSVPPSRFDAGTYTQCATTACNTAANRIDNPVIAYLHSTSSTTKFDEKTIFEVPINGTQSYLLNKESVIELGDFSFRNPPHFVNWVEPTVRDAQYETDALIDHLFYHQNTAPFVAYRLIQRVVTSNPSPRYIKAVVDAFKSGTYDGVTYSGRYGDLGAAVSAMLLDPEARSLTLDLDPSHGGLREPLVKLLHFMRAMDFTSKDGREVELNNVYRHMGQNIFQSPTVFNFYKPEYQPIGPVIGSDLVSPEAELGTAPWILGFLNGVTSLIKHGLSTCADGFGGASSYQKRVIGAGIGPNNQNYPAQYASTNCNRPAEPYYNPPRVGSLDGTSSDGTLDFVPTDPNNASSAVDELSLLLTAGRLSDASRSIIEYEYERMLNGSTQEYMVAIFRTCPDWGLQDITTPEECEVAARALQGTSGISDTTVQNDNRNSNRYRPKGCYYESNNLKFNVAGTNFGTCAGSYDCLCKRAGASHALKRAQELIVMTPEFHAVNAPEPANEPRVPPPDAVSLGRPYKAIVVLFLGGGLDSWNLLVPHSGCVPGNFSTNYEQYERIRGIVALPQDQLLPIEAPNGTQPNSVCSTFGVHPGLTIAQSLYNDGDAAFLANTGTLVEPMTKQEYLDRSKRRPPSLFAHNIQVRCTQSVHAQDTVAKGVLGRIVDALVEVAPGGDDSNQAAPETPATSPSPPPPQPPPPPPPFRTGAYSLAGIKKMLDGERPPSILDSSGAVRLNDFPRLQHNISNLTSTRQRSVFAETFASMIESSLASSETLGEVLQTVTMQSTRWTDTNGDGTVNSVDNNVPHRCTSLCESFEQIARVISSREVLQEERQVFYVEIGGFDTHSSAQERVQDRMEQINVALTAFVDEMKIRGIWDQVAVLTSSDFARTMDSNGAGTDHAWGGNYFLLGGGVRGGTIHGEYPDSLLSTSSVHVGRGRLLPTTSWEAVWNGLADWFGVPSASMTSVLPNAPNFPSNLLFTKEQLFNVTSAS